MGLFQIYHAREDHLVILCCLETTILELVVFYESHCLPVIFSHVGM